MRTFRLHDYLRHPGICVLCTQERQLVGLVHVMLMNLQVLVSQLVKFTRTSSSQVVRQAMPAYVLKGWVYAICIYVLELFCHIPFSYLEHVSPLKWNCVLCRFISTHCAYLSKISGIEAPVFFHAKFPC